MSRQFTSPSPSDLALKSDKITLLRGNHPILTNLSFSILRGALVAIVGPNGSGKSTLLEALAEGRRPSVGHLDTPPCQKRVYLPQLCCMRREFPLMVQDVVGSGLWPTLGFWRNFTPEHRKEIMHALSKVGLASFATQPIAHLSGGQFQRVLFARLMVQSGDLFLLDEPFTGVDEASIPVLWSLIETWQREKCTILLSIHDIEFVKKHIPYTLLLARDFSVWGKTADVLTDENMSKAYTRAYAWNTVC